MSKRLTLEEAVERYKGRRYQGDCEGMQDMELRDIQTAAEVLGYEFAEPETEVVWEDNTCDPRERISRLPDGELLFEYCYTEGPFWSPYAGGCLHSLRAAYRLGRQDEKEGRPEHG